MKQLFDLLPVVVFFLAYKTYDIYVATAVLMVASLIQMSIQKMLGYEVPRMQVVSLGLILVLGGVTLAFQDEMYLKWKVSVVNWLFALVFLGSHLIGRSTIIERMMGAQLPGVPSEFLKKLNLSWAGFFAFLGFLNLYVIYAYSTDFWVHFKLFGLMGLTLLFSVIQGVFLYLKLQKVNRKSNQYRSHPPGA